MGSEEVIANGSDVSSTRTRILAYLGELKPDDFVPAMKLCCDLSLRFTTAKNTLTMLEERGLVEKRKEPNKGSVVSFRIDPEAGTVQPNRVAEQGATMTKSFVPYIPPQWSDAYGKHPYTT